MLGIGEKYHPVPWSELDYDANQGGYVVPFSDGATEERAVRLARRIDEG